MRSITPHCANEGIANRLQLRTRTGERQSQPQSVVQICPSWLRRHASPKIHHNGGIGARQTAPHRLPKTRCQIDLVTRIKPAASPLLNPRPHLLNPIEMPLPKLGKGKLTHQALGRLCNASAFVLMFEVVMDQFFQIVIVVEDAFLAITKVSRDFAIAGFLK